MSIPSDAVRRHPAGSLGTGPTRRSFVGLSLASFVVLGLPDGMLGAAWPSMRQSLGAPVGDLGLILLAATAGAALVTVFVGALLRRVGVAALLALAGIGAAVGAAGYALAPGIRLILAVAVLIGAAAGMMDGGLNTAIGLTGRPRLVNLLHGAYGIGTAIGPLVVTAALLTGSWRPAYGVLVAFDLVLVVSWLRYRRGERNRTDPVAPEDAADDAPPPASEAPRVPGSRRRRYRGGVAAGLAVFFIYTGLEVGAGQWEASFSQGHLGLSAPAAGLATFGYWAALTAVRIGLAAWPHPVPPAMVVRWGSAVAVLAAAAIWWQPSSAVSIVGFVVLGGALAGVFPALIALTPGRIGARRAHHVIAWQVGAAAVGGAAISACIGLLIGTTSLAVLGPSLTVLAALLVGAVMMLNRLAPVPSTEPLG